MNSAVDNPLVFPEEKKVGAPKRAMGAQVLGVVISGGNFHGEPLAFALDFLAIALSGLAGISERRLERLVNPTLNEGLPPFLAPGAGLNSGFMMPQVTAAALVSENKVLSHPASVDSITTSGNKEDYVSMGMTAANKLLRVVANTRNVLAIEALAAAQALDFRAPLKTSKRGEAAHAAIRSVSPPFTEDRIFTPDIEHVAALIAERQAGRSVAVERLLSPFAFRLSLFAFRFRLSPVALRFPLLGFSPFASGSSLSASSRCHPARRLPSLVVITSPPRRARDLLSPSSTQPRNFADERRFSAAPLCLALP